MILGGAITLVLLVAINFSCLFFLQGVTIANANSSTDTYRDIYYGCSVLFQVIALILGATYFYNNINYDKDKVLRAKRNQLIYLLIDDLKNARDQLNTFFYADFKEDIEFRKFKDSTVELFTSMSIFIENCESSFDFSSQSYDKLVAPSSIIQTSQLFSILSIEELKRHDLMNLKYQFSTSINHALGVCWAGLK